jgi:hypothetical protein
MHCFPNPASGELLFPETATNDPRPDRPLTLDKESSPVMQASRTTFHH